jgi:feruloyl-CoA synthase
MTEPSFRSIKFGPRAVTVDRRADGTELVLSDTPLGTYPDTLCQVLAERAALHPERTFLAARETPKSGNVMNGDWRKLTYGAAQQSADAIGQALLNRGLGLGSTAMMLSRNSIEFAQFMMGALAAGVPVAPISPAYSLLSADFEILKDIAALLEPDIIFVQDANRFERAMSALSLDGIEVVAVTGETTDTAVSDFASLLAVQPTEEIAKVTAAIDPDAVAKYLFTSGSTGQPKAVINTHRMLCSNLKMNRLMRPLDDGVHETMVDWLPWHHTYGGNATFNNVMNGGGSLYLDYGRPVPEHFQETVRNLKDISPTIYSSVPAAYAMLAPEMEADTELRDNFFAQLRLMIFGGAALPADLYERMQALSIASTGERVLFISGYGATEASPSISGAHWINERHDLLGLPLPGMEMKLIPEGDVYEIRLRGPNITPGYYKRPDLTWAAFDDEGFYRIGDAARWAEPGNPEAGLTFAGRIAENFKLLTGTWVKTGILRTTVLAAATPLLKDAVIAAPDREFLTVLAWPNFEAMRNHFDVADDVADAGLLTRPDVVAYLQKAFGRHNQTHPGSAARIRRIILLVEPPSIDQGEITDKGYINQRIALQRRADEVTALYETEPGPAVIVIS